MHINEPLTNFWTKRFAQIWFDFFLDHDDGRWRDIYMFWEKILNCLSGNSWLFVDAHFIQLYLSILLKGAINFGIKSYYILEQAMQKSAQRWIICWPFLLSAVKFMALIWLEKSIRAPRLPVSLSLSLWWALAPGDSSSFTALHKIHSLF